MTEGLLQEIKLAEMVQLIAMSEKTGDLELKPLIPAQQQNASTPVGHLIFRDGHPHAAILGDRTGEAAVKSLFLWEAGFFRFVECGDKTLPPANLYLEMEALFFLGMKQLGEWTEARARVPTLRAVLQPIAEQSPPPTHTPEAQLLAACDGAQQLNTIAERLGWGRLHCRDIAAKLLINRYAIYTEPSMAEQLVRLIVLHSLPTLGAAADLFCDDALLAVGIAPEQLTQITTIPKVVVQQILAELQRSVAEVLGLQRASALTQLLANELNVPRQETSERGVTHV